MSEGNSAPDTMMTKVSDVPWMKPRVLVEIAAAVDERERVELIRAAYRYSRSGLVALALRGVSRQSVDRALDGVVDGHETGRPGVIYLDADELRDDVVTTASQARVIIASTDSFRVELLERGIPAVNVEGVTRLLAQTSVGSPRREDSLT